MVLVIAFTGPFGYACVTKNEEVSENGNHKNLCAQIPIDLHERVSEERERLGQTTSEYITNLIQDYANSPAVSGSNSFADVSETAYYYNATLWAMSEKVTEGTSATTFSPNDLCTRGQIVTFLYRYMGK